MDRFDRLCDFCGGSYKAASTRSEFCSPACRRAAYREKQTAAITEALDRIERDLGRVRALVGQEGR